MGFGLHLTEAKLSDGARSLRPMLINSKGVETLRSFPIPITEVRVFNSRVE